MGKNIMRNWVLREFRVQVDWPSPIWQLWDPIRHVITPIRGLPNSIRHVIPLISHICLYLPHHSHLHPPSLSFSSTTQASSQNTKLSHPSLSLHAMIMSWHWSTAYTEYRICRVQHFTKYSIHRVQHPPKIVCLPSILMITSWPLNVTSASGVHPYTIDRHQPALDASSKVIHIVTFPPLRVN